MPKSSCSFTGTHLPRDLDQTTVTQLQRLGWQFKGICPDSNTRHAYIPEGWYECLHEDRRAFKDARNRVRFGHVEVFVRATGEDLHVWTVFPFYRVDDYLRILDANGRLRYTGRGANALKDVDDWLHNHGWPDPLAGWD